jgi:hypothetical protein
MEKNNLFGPPIKKRRNRKTTENPPETIQDYSLQSKGQGDVIFNRIVNVPTLPCVKSALSYLVNSQNLIVNSQYLQFPEMDTLSRPNYLLDFMREANSKERPCFRQNCQSVAMGKFKCRELIIPRKGREEVAGWCIMCHYYETNRLFNENYDAGTVVNHPLHAFIVLVDSPGEYRLDRTILGTDYSDDKMRGIYGPFPLFHMGNYKMSTTPNGLKCWIEDEKNLVSTTTR